MSISFSRGLLISTTSALVSFSAFSVTATAASNELLRIGTTQEADSLNQLVGSSVIGTFINSMGNRNTLVNLDAKGNVVPYLAEKVPTLENGLAKKLEKGGKTWIEADWTIRADAKWGDGTPITAKDIVLSWNIGKSPNVSVASRDIYTRISDIVLDPSNPKKLKTIFTEARWDFNQQVQLYALPSHLEGPVYEQHKGTPEGYDRNSLYVTKPETKGLYSGPFRISELKLGSHVRLVQNENWTGKKPKIKSILVQFIPDSNTLEANLLAGKIDFIAAAGLNIDQYLQLTEKAKKQKLPFKGLSVPQLAMDHLQVNMDDPFLKSTKVRQALLHGIDREGISKSLFNGIQPVAHQFFAPNDPWALSADKVKKYEYSARKARKLLAEEGFKLNSAGELEKDGKKFSIQFITTAGNKTRESVQTIIKENMKQLGIEIVIKNEPAKVFFGETTTKRLFKGFAMFALVTSPYNVPKTTLNSDNIPSKENQFSGQNYSGWKNKRVDEIIEKMETEFDSNKRKTFADELSQIWISEIPQLPLYNRASLIVIPSRMEGVTMVSHQFAEGFYAENWEIK